MELTSSIQELKGVGENRARSLKKIGIDTVEDIITYYPRSYDDRTNVVTIADIKQNEKNTIKAVVCTKPQNIKKGKLIMTKVKLRDESGYIFAVWFGQAYLKNTFKLNEEYYFTGKVIFKYGMMQLQSPDFSKQEQQKGNKILPIYSLTKNLTQKVVRNLIENALKQYNIKLQEYLPNYIREKYKLANYNYSVYQIHFPITDDDFFVARRRLVFEEFFLLQLGLLQIKNLVGNKKKGIQLKDILDEEIFLNQLPFQLTNAQKKVWKEIKEDLKSNNIMNRLVQGDVGSGKTIIAALAILFTAKNNYQSALMVPTEVLARQHFESITEQMQEFGIRCGLLVGSLKKREKNHILESLKLGTIDLVIGTHAIIQENIEFNNLGLVITDEQHRFGVRQRQVLTEKGMSPNVLIMSATPIPRTLALILYGDLDISIIDELPPGRQIIKTYSVESSYHERIYNFIKDEVHKGRQAYIICPMVEESEKSDLKSVIEYTTFLKENTFSENNIEYLHGKMKPKEKNMVMEQFAQGNIDILVSTTVIEVGVNVPNSSIILIENAERFGLAQLHQLRGRVGRGKYQSYCILITDSKNKVTKERMKIMTESNDGFKVSEVDLKLRGPGDFFGIKQHGLPEFKIANIYEDMDILQEAQSAAKEIIEKDPLLISEEHYFINKKINKFFQKNMNSIPL